MTVLKKDELLEIAAQEKGITKKEAENFLKETFEFFQTVVTEYAAGFRLGDIGTFDVVSVGEKERTFTNPQTKEKFDKVIPAHYALKFKVNSRTKQNLEALRQSELNQA